MRNNILILITAIVCSWLLIQFYMGKIQPAAAPRESAYDRVLRTGVLRCAYGVWEPGVMHDPNTGAFSGIVYDFMQEVGKSLNLKVEYTLETPWDSVGATLHGGKADAHCAGIWATPARSRSMAFTEPMFFSPTVAFARADDNRFDFNPARLNQPDVTVALSDDDITTELYNHDTPLAKKYELAQLEAPEQLFLVVATKKADVLFNSPGRLQTYERNNPGQIKIIPMARPMRIFGDVIAVDSGETQLRDMLNTAITQMIDSGLVERLTAKYAAQHDMSFVVPVDRPYTWKSSTPAPASK